MRKFVRRWTTWLLVAVLSLSLCAGTALAVGNGASSGKDKITVKNGWEEKNGSYYFYQNGEKVKGWQTAYDEWYYFQPSSGKLQTGWLQLDGKQYHFDQNGTMNLGWTELQDKWYCFGYDGAMLTDWVQIGGTFYFFDENGVMQTSWLEDRDEWYYLDGNGAMETGWLKDNGSWYYLYPNGTMARNETITSGGKKYTFARWGGLTATEMVQTTGSVASENSATVYVSNNGKIHTKSNCSGMKHYTTMTYDEAVALGYVKCKKCY